MIIFSQINKNFKKLKYHNQNFINLLNNYKNFILYEYNYHYFEFKKFKYYFIKHSYYYNISNIIKYYNFVIKLHRNNGPAYIRYHKNGKIRETIYYLNGEKVLS